MKEDWVFVQMQVKFALLCSVEEEVRCATRVKECGESTGLPVTPCNVALDVLFGTTLLISDSELGFGAVFAETRGADTLFAVKPVDNFLGCGWKLL